MPSPHESTQQPERTVDAAERLRPYLPRLLVSWLNEIPGTTVRELEGSVVFVDISGFTKMSERLARHGKVGAEEVTDVLGSVFAQLLVVAYENGGSLVKFGGDALMLFFAEEDHALRAARAAFGMRSELRSIGRIETSAGLVTLRMSVGVGSGTFHLFLVGRSHRELMVTGPAASQTVLMENTADAGEILVSPATALALPPEALGAQKGEGLLLRREPTDVVSVPAEPVHRGDADELSACIPVAVREHLLEGRADPEHRQVTVAFIHFEGMDDMLTRHEGDLAAFALDELVTTVQDAADRNGVTFLAPTWTGTAARSSWWRGRPTPAATTRSACCSRCAQIADAEPSIDIRIGVNSGPVFVGDVGPSVPAYLHGDGRRGEPRRARDVQGRAGRDPRHAAGPGSLGRAVRDRGARAVHGEGKEASGHGVPRREDPGQQPLGRPRRPAARRTRARARRAPGDAEGGRRWARDVARDRRRCRHRQDPADAGGASAGAGASLA